MGGGLRRRARAEGGTGGGEEGVWQVGRVSLSPDSVQIIAFLPRTEQWLFICIFVHTNAFAHCSF